MSDAGDEIPVEPEAATVEVAAEVAPKGKLSVEDALQVWFFSNTHSNFIADLCLNFISKF
jgi:hypothetical protein